MTTQRIAIIGAGVSGLACAWALDRSGIDVTVYERDEVIGGHARTITIEHDGQPITMDVGVEAICPRMYPNIMAMARRFGTPTIPYRFGYTVTDERLGYCGVNHQDGAYWRAVEPEVLRFVAEMHDQMALNSVEVISCSIGEYLASRGYSETFTTMLSALGALLGQELDHDRDTSVLVYAIAITSGLVSLVADSGMALCFEGGMAVFARALAAPFASRIRLGCGVTRVERRPDGVWVTDVRGETERFDQVVFAVDGSIAHAMLADRTPLEENLLSSCQLQRYGAVLHRDPSVLIPGIEPERRTFTEVNAGVTTANFGVMNLDRLKIRDLFLTYSDEAPIDPEKVYFRTRFQQAKDNTYSFEVKRALHQIQGRDRTWFASAWTTASHFETAAVSGLVIARALGAEYPFAGDPRATRSFEIFEGLMLRGQEDFSLVGM